MMRKQQSLAEDTVAGFTITMIWRNVWQEWNCCVTCGNYLQLMKHWKGATVAPGNSATLDQLKDPTRRPRDPLPHELFSHIPGRPFELDEQLLSRNLRSARRGAAAGPSEMTTEHLRLLCSIARVLPSC